MNIQLYLNNPIDECCNNSLSLCKTLFPNSSVTISSRTAFVVMSSASEAAAASGSVDFDAVRFGDVWACTHCGGETSFVTGSLPRHAVPCGHLVCGSCVAKLSEIAPAEEKHAEPDAVPEIRCPRVSCRRALASTVDWPAAFGIAYRDKVRARLAEAFTDQGDALPDEGKGESSSEPPPAQAAADAVEAKAAPHFERGAPFSVSDNLVSGFALSADVVQSRLRRWATTEVDRVNRWEERVTQRVRTFAQETRARIAEAFAVRMQLGSELYAQRVVLRASLDGVRTLLASEDAVDAHIPAATRALALDEGRKLVDMLCTARIGLPSAENVAEWLRLPILTPLHDSGQMCEVPGRARANDILVDIAATKPPRFCARELDLVSACSVAFRADAFLSPAAARSIILKRALAHSERFLPSHSLSLSFRRPRWSARQTSPCVPKRLLRTRAGSSS